MTMVKEDLVFLKTSIVQARELIKELSGNYDSKIHYDILGPSTVVSINSSINSIIKSTEYLEGHYLFCDEIDPVQLTKYLIRTKKYEAEYEVILYYVAYYLKRRINETYKSLKKGVIPLGLQIQTNKQNFKEYMEKCKDRQTRGMKMIRS